MINKVLNMMFLNLVMIFIASQAIARPENVEKIPNGKVNTCLNCHYSKTGGERNDFGIDFENNDESWDQPLSLKDSDGDGHSNGTELQDPEGTWSEGGPDPGDSSLVSNPGDATSVPPTEGCPLSMVLGNDSSYLADLRNFRDDTLGKTPKGRRYIRWYYQYGSEISEQLLRDGFLRIRMADLLEEIWPEMVKMIYGKELALDEAEREKIIGFLTEFEAGASPGLKKLIKIIKKDVKKME